MLDFRFFAQVCVSESGRAFCGIVGSFFLSKYMARMSLVLKLFMSGWPGSAVMPPGAAAATSSE